MFILNHLQHMIHTKQLDSMPLQEKACSLCREVKNNDEEVTVVNIQQTKASNQQ